MSQEMHEVRKFIGVTPSQLAALHELWEDPEESPLFSFDGYTWESEGETYKDQVIFATILSSKLDTDHKTYTVEIKLRIRVLIREEDVQKVLVTPMSAVQAIHEVLEIYPEDQGYDILE